MADHWIENHKRDSWRRQAKSSGYRARSAFKLLQIQEKFKLVREGDVVLDVGCHPGGWSQVAVELVGEEGVVIGLDWLIGTDHHHAGVHERLTNILVFLLETQVVAAC